MNDLTARGLLLDGKSGRRLADRQALVALWVQTYTEGLLVIEPPGPLAISDQAEHGPPVAPDLMAYAELRYRGTGQALEAAELLLSRVIDDGKHEPGLLAVITDLGRALRELEIPFGIVGTLVPELLLDTRPTRMTNATPRAARRRVTGVTDHVQASRHTAIPK